MRRRLFFLRFVYVSVTRAQQRGVRVEQGFVSTQGFILPVAAWDVPAQRAAVVAHIPFTHPSHVPALLQVLRHQSAINALLSSCVAPECESRFTLSAA